MKNINDKREPERKSQSTGEISVIRKSQGQPNRNRLKDFEKLDEQREHEANMKEWAHYIEERECPGNPGGTELER